MKSGRRPRSVAFASVALLAVLATCVAAVAGNGVTVLTVGGKPLPVWLAFSLRLREFVAVEVPEGGLPVPVVIGVGSRRFNLVVSEGPAPQQQARGTLQGNVYNQYKK